MRKTDAQLLKAFSRDRDDRTFLALAERYTRMIYGAALRRSCHPQLAEEATQNVLSLLVKKAPDLAEEPARLPGWLHRAATLEAGNLLRIESRHQRRKIALMNDPIRISTTADQTWKDALPHLDEALQKLPETDQRVVIMHFLQGMTHKEIALVIGKTAAAVQRQCHRSLGKLSQRLRKRGVALSASALAAGLSGEQLHAVSAAFTSSAAKSALLSPGTTSLPILTKSLLIMNAKNKAILTGAVVALIAAAPILWQQSRISDLESKINESALLSGARASPLATTPNDRSLLQTPSQRKARRYFASREAELEKAREKLKAAQAELGELSRPFTEDISSSAVKAELAEDEVLVTGGFLLENGNYQFTFLSPKRENLDDGDEGILVSTRVIELTEEGVAAIGLETLATNARNTLQHAEAWSSEDAASAYEAFNYQLRGGQLVAGPNILVRPGQNYQIEFADGSGGYSLGGTLDFTDDANEGFSISTRIEHNAQDREDEFKPVGAGIEGSESPTG